MDYNKKPQAPSDNLLDLKNFRVELGFKSSDMVRLTEEYSPMI